MDKQCFCCKKRNAENEVLIENEKTVGICIECLNERLSDGSVVEAFDDDGSGQKRAFVQAQNALITYDGTVCISARYAKQFNYITCPKCGRLHSDKNTKYKLCPDCSEKSGYVKCGKCGEWKDNCDIVLNSIICKDCAESAPELLVNRYHTSHKSVYRYVGFNGEPKNFCGLGFELEIDAFERLDKNKFKSEICRIVTNHNALSELFLERDRSLLNGIELISQPHTITAMREFIDGKMDKLLSELREKTQAQDCSPLASLHVHISRNAFGDTAEEQNINIAKLQYWVSRNVRLLMHIGRRKTFRKCAFPAAPLTRAEALEAVEMPETRYVAINVRNENTVEFRFIKSTMYTPILRASVDFCWHLATKIGSLDWTELEGDKLLEGLPYSVTEYFRSIGII